MNTRNIFKRRQTPNGKRLKWISLAVALTLVMSAPASVPVSSASGIDTVWVPAAELEELYAGVDSLLLERRLLQIDLWESRSTANVDRVLFEDRLALLKDAQHRSWFVKALQSPMMDAVYFILGAYVGAQAITYVR